MKTFDLIPVDGPNGPEHVVQEKAEPSSDPTPTLSVKHKAMASDDYAHAREKMREVLDAATQAVQEAAVIASQAQHPKMYEALAGIVGAAAVAAKEYMATAKTHKDVVTDRFAPLPNQEKKIEGTTINTAVFVGSTADLQQALKNKNKKEERELDGDAS